VKTFFALKLYTACSILLSIFAAIQPAFALAATEAEPNNSFTTRQFLPFGTNTVDGSINADDIDFFTFSNLAPRSRFKAEITSGSFDSILGLLDDSGNILAIDDDFGRTSSYLSLLRGTVPASGNLNLAVTGYSEFNEVGLIGNHSESGSYTLSLETFIPVAYTATEVPFTFQDISGIGTRILAGLDDTSTSANLGFNFNFFGKDYNSVSWTPNGLMTFGGSNSRFINVDLTTSAPNSITSSGIRDLPSIAVLWDDWQFSSPGTDSTYYYETMGTKGNQRFITQWNLAEGCCSGSPRAVTFQSVLFEGSNDILFSYLDVDSGDSRAFGSSSTVGIRNTEGQLTGENAQWSFNSPVIRNKQSILFKMVSVPESSPTLGMLLLGMLGTKDRLKRQQRRYQKKRYLSIL